MSLRLIISILSVCSLLLSCSTDDVYDIIDEDAAKPRNQSTTDTSEGLAPSDLTGVTTITTDYGSSNFTFNTFSDVSAGTAVWNWTSASYTGTFTFTKTNPDIAQLTGVFSKDGTDYTVVTQFAYETATTGTFTQEITPALSSTTGTTGFFGNFTIN